MSEHVQQSPFETLGLAPVYRVDRDQIERAYRTRLASAHPDTASGGLGLDPASLNKARASLLDDEQRAVALLELLGGPGASECKDLPDGFLMEMMDTRQQIEEAIESGGEQQRERWERWGIEQRRAHRERIAELFDALGDEPDARGLRAIRVELNAWRYIERLIEQLDPEYDPARADFR